MMKRFDRLLLLIEAIKNLLERLVHNERPSPKAELNAENLLTSKEVQSLFGITDGSTENGSIRSLSEESIITDEMISSPYWKSASIGKGEFRLIRQVFE